MLYTEAQSQALDARHATLDARIEALPDSTAIAVATAEGARGLATTSASAARDYLKELHPDDTERALAVIDSPSAQEPIVAEIVEWLRSRAEPGDDIDSALFLEAARLIERKPAVTGLRLQETIGTGSKLYTVVCTGDDWDGWASWLVRANDHGIAIYTVQAQYHDLPQEDRPTDWQATFVGDLA